MKEKARSRRNKKRKNVPYNYWAIIKIYILVIARFFVFMILYLYLALTCECVAQPSKMDVPGGLGVNPPTRKCMVGAYMHCSRVCENIKKQKKMDYLEKNVDVDVWLSPFLGTLNEILL